MGVTLHCPNCGATVGEANSENNYTNVYHRLDENGKPECPNCGAGEGVENFERTFFIAVVVVFVVFISLAIFFGEN